MHCIYIIFVRFWVLCSVLFILAQAQNLWDLDSDMTLRPCSRTSEEISSLDSHILSAKKLDPIVDTFDFRPMDISGVAAMDPSK